MHDEADDPDNADRGTRLQGWRGKRPRREVGEALVAELASLPEAERGSVGADHIRLWEQGRATLPTGAVVAALARVLKVPPQDLEDAIGWERIRRAEATDFVRQQIALAQPPPTPGELTPDERALLDVVRGILERRGQRFAPGLVRGLAALVRGADARTPTGAENESQQWKDSPLGKLLVTLVHFELLERHNEGDEQFQRTIIDALYTAARATSLDVGYWGPMRTFGGQTVVIGGPERIEAMAAEEDKKQAERKARRSSKKPKTTDGDEP
jgi:transcriptional regulator with XRE-family HTH domain